MKGLLRRLRGIIGMGVTWAVGLAGLFTLAGLVFGGTFVPGLAFTGGFVGLVAGGAFAVILSIAERRQRLRDLSLWRMALWGGVGGAIVAGATNLIAGSGGLIWPFVGSVAFIGAVASTGTVAVAKRAERKLIGDGDDSVSSLEGDNGAMPALEGE
jgi:multisubunit Na+/H+ antiporter MnhB subunit